MARIVEPCNWTGCWLRPFLRDLHIEAHPALAELAPAQSEMAYLMEKQPVRSVETDALCIAYVEHGPTNGGPVILSRGFSTTCMLSMKWLRSWREQERESTPHILAVRPNPLLPL